MIYTLNITIKRVEGAIIRTLGLIGRRGFAVTAVNTSDSACDDEMQLALTVESQGRSIDHLVHQVRKLFDVREVNRPRAPERIPIEERQACLM